MLGPDVCDKFLPYLDKSSEKSGLEWHQRGLIPGAPLEAIKQYDEYQKMIEEAEKDDIYL